MASSLSFTVLVLLSAAMATLAQLPPLPQGCTTQVAVLLPCLPFVQGQAMSPGQQCCNALGGVVQNSPVCLCALVNAGTGGGVSGVNTTLALTLPSRCHLAGVNANQCNGSAPAPAPSSHRPISQSDTTAAGAPTPSPATSPARRRRHPPSRAPAVTVQPALAPSPSSSSSSAEKTTSSAPAPSPVSSAWRLGGSIHCLVGAAAVLACFAL